MKKIVMVTLDERPCNYYFPQLMPQAGYELVIPPKHLMGNKKIPGDVEALQSWLLDNIENAFAAVLSLDTLIYGGIVPSRLHQLSLETLIKRSQIIEKVKMKNPTIQLYAFQLIMRCPSYSLSDEEPDYYDNYGSEIHRFGKYTHLEKLNLLSHDDAVDFANIKTKLDSACLHDYMARRDKNLAVLMHNLQKLKNGVIDFFIVPQDDAAVYGFTSMDQMTIREYLKEHHLWRKVAMYPAADDTGLTLLARAVNTIHQSQPKVYVYYASAKGSQVIPAFEDRIIDETIKYHILSVQGQRVYSLDECDILLAVNIGSAMLNPNDSGYVIAYDIERNLAEYVQYLEYAKRKHKIVAVADVAHCNYGDEELIRLLRDSGDLFLIDAYAGWNTSSNTIGTVLCQAILFLLGNDENGNRNFLVHRYFEDVGYCAYTRETVTDQYLPRMGFDYFNVREENGEAARLVKEVLLSYMKEHYFEVYDQVESLQVRLPWRRMFEVEVGITIKDRSHD